MTFAVLSWPPSLAPNVSGGLVWPRSGGRFQRLFGICADLLFLLAGYSVVVILALIYLSRFPASLFASDHLYAAILGTACFKLSRGAYPIDEANR